ncbi:MAG: hypothetical protein GF416_03255 [Candidatus Altiarchaeales archaeon]|nr:hypothetical protein [Candidatus Altiarchaeales archaeon]MBD3416136.1 hypothetical protein [Candidatus Altiarchaeales archaeon]
MVETDKDVSDGGVFEEGATPNADAGVGKPEVVDVRPSSGGGFSGEARVVDSGNPVVKKSSGGLLSTIGSAIALIIALLVIYYALTFLLGSDFNLDALLTGEQVTRLP